MSQIVVLGGTGFIGRALILGLQGRGHAVTVLARSPERARAQLPVGVEVADFRDDAALTAVVARADAVFDLAGESIAGKRWTRRRKQVLIASRVDTRRRLVDAIAKRANELPVLIATSAVGWYGDRGDEELSDASAPGTGFLADLCRDWEAVAAGARASRVVITRFGIVLGREGGALRPLLRVARLGLAGPLGGGAQWVSWIHIDDLVGALVHLLDGAARSGPLAVTAPSPVRQRELACAIGDAVHRRARLPTPRAALRLGLGEQADMLLASQRVIPRALLAAGFAFRFPRLEDALADLAGEQVAIVPVRRTDLPEAGYLRRRRPRFTLRTRTDLDAPLADVFAFFSSPKNLAALTPPGLAFQIEGDAGAPIDAGTTIDYRIRVAGLPLRWRTRIERWAPGALFVDSQERGPYRAWWHEHHFIERDGKTIMEDVVHYAPPLGPLGAVANRLFVAPMLRRIFGFRRDAIRFRFGHRAA
jgi:hypothetical protein